MAVAAGIGTAAHADADAVAVAAVVVAAVAELEPEPVAPTTDDLVAAVATAADAVVVVVAVVELVPEAVAPERLYKVTVDGLDWSQHPSPPTHSYSGLLGAVPVRLDGHLLRSLEKPRRVAMSAGRCPVFAPWRQPRWPLLPSSQSFAAA